MAPDNLNVRAEGIPFFTPAQVPPAGTALRPTGKALPKIYQPLKIRGVEFHNRIWLSPLCQYSAENGKLTPWHMAHLGGILTRGPGHIMIEATAVTANGRITPEDSGIWSDDHIGPLTQITQFAHSQSQKIGIQLAHAGRKASTVAPWISGHPTASKEVGGWPDDVWAPSDVAFEASSYPHPKALSREGIKGIVRAFEEGARRAVAAGFDLVEIHSAHGYLLHSFLSPVSNKRTDEYGGSWENRTRFPLEIVDAVRKVIPDDMPLLFRISATDWLEEVFPDEPSWRSEDTARLAPLLYARGVDLLDVSTGGNHPKQKIRGGPAYQAPFAHDVMRAINADAAFPPPSSGSNSTGNARPPRLLVGSVGAITKGPIAEGLLQEAKADVVIVGRQFLRDTFLVWTWAEELRLEGVAGVDIQLPHQIGWGFKGRGKKMLEGSESERDEAHHGLDCKKARSKI